MSLILPVELPADDQLTPCSYALDVIEGDPAEREFVYVSQNGFTVAAWAAQPYAENITDYPGDELAQVVRGSLTLTDPDGTARTFGPGESYVMKAGWSGEFRVHEPFLKYFAMSAPQA